MNCHFCNTEIPDGQQHIKATVNGKEMEFCLGVGLGNIVPKEFLTEDPSTISERGLCYSTFKTELFWKGVTVMGNVVSPRALA